MEPDIVTFKAPELPKDVIRQILLRLNDGLTLAQCSQVCKSWRSVCEENYVWFNPYNSISPISLRQGPKERSGRRETRHHSSKERQRMEYIQSIRLSLSQSQPASYEEGDLVSVKSNIDVAVTKEIEKTKHRNRVPWKSLFVSEYTRMNNKPYWCVHCETKRIRNERGMVMSHPEHPPKGTLPMCYYFDKKVGV